MAENTIKEDNGQRGSNPAPMILLAAGAAIGLGVAAWILKSREDGAKRWDTESLIDACDAASARMDEILLGEYGQRRVG